MSARDVFHDAVRAALIKDGWEITADPLRIEVEGFNVSIDLAAERVIAASRDDERIAVEIKTLERGYPRPSTRRGGIAGLNDAVRCRLSWANGSTLHIR